MKKILLIGCLILSACQTATVAPTPTLVPLPTETPLPTAIPATDTPVPTPTIAFSPTPLPRFFTNEFDSAFEGWGILQAGNDFVPNVRAENSTLLLQMDAPYSWVYAIYGSESYSNVYVETKFENRAGSPASVGLVCRYSEENGWFEYNVTSDGTYNLLYGQWLATGVADYLPITDGTSNLVQPSGAAQQISLLCADTVLTLSINGTVVRSLDVARYELTEGKVGVTTASYENTPILVALDSVTVREP
ncbi:MAG TPA: hypothetical protein VFQ23_20345 [Anaerolineales bacterium]|nr:hypothetical protein [Anaerolineales bacterium]